MPPTHHTHGVPDTNDPRNRLAVALDLPDARQALALVDRLGHTCQWFKVGMELYYAAGNSFVHETESQVILNGSYDIGFTMDLACKDAGFASEFGRRFGVPLRLAGVMEQIFIEGRARFGGDAWSSMIVKLLEDAVGTPLRAPGFPARLGPEHS